jgi:O-antigen/teichoic acid export membrane protein
MKNFNGVALRRSFIGVSGIYALSVLLMLVGNVILARTLTVSDFGTFGLVLTIASVLALPVSGGMPLLVTREVARYTQQDNWPSYRGLVKVAYCWVALIFFGLVPAIFVWGNFAGGLASPQLIIILILVPLLGLNAIRIGVLRGLGRPVVAETLAQVIQPILMITGYLGLAWIGSSSATNALWWYAATLGMVFFLATIAVSSVQHTGVRQANSDLSDFPRWKRSLSPLIVTSAIALLSTQASILISGVLGQEEVVAFLRVAERGAMFIIIPFHVLGSIIGPHMVSALDTNDINKIKDIVRKSSIMMISVSVPTSVVIIYFGESILDKAFGPIYGEQSYLPMLIVSIVQIFSMGFGHIGMLILMSGRENQILISQSIALCVNSVTCILLIGPFGAVGASIGVAAGVAVSTIINVFLVKRQFGFIPGLFVSGIKH